MWKTREILNPFMYQECTGRANSHKDLLEPWERCGVARFPRYCQYTGLERASGFGRWGWGWAHWLNINGRRSTYIKTEGWCPTPALRFLAGGHRFLLLFPSLTSRDQGKADFYAEAAFGPVEGRYFAAMEAHGPLGDGQS